MGNGLVAVGCLMNFVEPVGSLRSGQTEGLWARATPEQRTCLQLTAQSL